MITEIKPNKFFVYGQKPTFDKNYMPAPLCQVATGFKGKLKYSTCYHLFFITDYESLQ